MVQFRAFLNTITLCYRRKHGLLFPSNSHGIDNNSIACILEVNFNFDHVRVGCLPKSVRSGFLAAIEAKYDRTFFLNCSQSYPVLLFHPICEHRPTCRRAVGRWDGPIWLHFVPSADGMSADGTYHLPTFCPIYRHFGQSANFI